jgi:hypothetical protein
MAALNDFRKVKLSSALTLFPLRERGALKADRLKESNSSPARRLRLTNVKD